MYNHLTSCMNCEEFQAILDMAIHSKNQQERITSSQMYMKFLSDQPGDYVEYCLQILEQNAKVADLAAVVLKKNIGRGFDSKIVQFLIENVPNGVQELLMRLLQLISRNTKHAHVIAITAGELSTYLISTEVDTTFFYEFIVQALEQNQTALSRNALTMLRAPCGCGGHKLIPYKDGTMQILRQAAAIEDMQCRLQLLKSATTLVSQMSYEFSPFKDDQEELSQLLVQTASALLGGGSFQQETISELIDVLETNTTCLQLILPDILQISASLMQMDTMENIDMGVSILDAVVEGMYEMELSDEQCESIFQLVLQCIRFLTLIGDDYKESCLSAGDFNNIDDENHIQSAITTLVYHFATSSFTDLLDLLHKYNEEPECPNKQYALSISAGISLGADYFIDEEQSTQLIGMLLQCIQCNDPSVLLRCCVSFRNTFEQSQFKKVKRALADEIIKQEIFEKLLNSGIDVLIQIAIDTMCWAAQELGASYCSQILQLASVVVTTFCESNNMVTRTLVAKLVEQILKQTNNAEIAQASIYYINEISHQQEIALVDSDVLRLYYCQQLCLTACLIAQSLNQRQNEVFEVVLRIYKANAQPSLTRTAIQTLTKMAATVNMDLLAPQILAMTHQIMHEKSMEKIEGIVMDQETYNGHVHEQNKECIRLLTAFAKYAPQATFESKENAIEAIQVANFSFYDFPLVGAFLFQLPKLAIESGDQSAYLNIVNHVKEQIEENILNEKVHRSVEEATILVKDLIYLLEAASLLGNTDNQELLQYIGEIFVKIIDLAKASFEKTLKELFITESQEEDMPEAEIQQNNQKTKAEMEFYWQFSDTIAEFASYCFKNQMIVQELLTIAEQHTPECIGAQILQQAIIHNINRQQVIDSSYLRYYQLLLQSDIPDRPIAAFLAECCKYQSKQIAKHTKISDFGEIDDGFVFAFLVQFSVTYKKEEDVVELVQLFSEHEFENGRGIFLKALVLGIKAKKLNNIREPLEQLIRSLYELDQIRLAWVKQEMNW